jgi:DNA-binding PadR family transcriptional regulator
VVYPTLTFLEEAGYATSAPEGNKKVFSITAEGRAHLAGNRAAVEHLLDHLERFGRKMERAKEWFDWRDDDDGRERRGVPEGLRKLNSLRRRLRAALADALDAEAEKRAAAVKILEDAADALEALLRR